MAFVTQTHLRVAIHAVVPRDTQAQIVPQVIKILNNLEEI